MGLRGVRVSFPSVPVSLVETRTICVAREPLLGETCPWTEPLTRTENDFNLFSCDEVRLWRIHVTG